MELDIIDIFAQYFLNFSGSLFDHSTVKFGSGQVQDFPTYAGSGKSSLLTSDRPSIAIPPIDSVTHVGSPLNSSLYSGVRANLTNT